jgi:hypothetical protein
MLMTLASLRIGGASSSGRNNRFPPRAEIGVDPSFSIARQLINAAFAIRIGKYRAQPSAFSSAVMNSASSGCRCGDVKQGMKIGKHSSSFAVGSQKNEAHHPAALIGAQLGEVRPAS